MKQIKLYETSQPTYAPIDPPIHIPITQCDDLYDRAFKSFNGTRRVIVVARREDSTEKKNNM